MVKKFHPDTCQAFCEGIFDGLTIAEAAKGAGIATKTAKNWLAKGRKEGDGPYADFAASVDEARTEHDEKEEPLDYDELKLVVSKSAKGGSVSAQKLLYEMLQRESKEGGSGEEEDDPFGESGNVSGPRAALHAV